MQDIINDWLLKNGGLNPYGEALFRVVWAPHQLEKRKGTFRDFSGDIFLREVTEIREVPKYWYIGERFILERWCPPESNAEIDTSRGSYEPVFVFEDKNGNPLPLALKPIQFLRYYAEMTKITPAERQRIAEELENQEVQEFIGKLS